MRTGGVLAVRVALLAATLLLLARVLGPTSFGTFAGVAALAVIAGSLASLGTHLIVMRDTAQDRERGDESTRYAVWATTTGALTLLTIFLLVTLLWLRPTEIGLAGILAIGVADTFLHPFLQLVSARLLGQGKVVTSQLLLTLPVVLRLVSVITLHAAPPADALATYCLLYSLSMLLALALALVASERVLPPLHTWRSPDQHEWADARRYAVLNITAASPGELDKALSLRLLSAEDAGLYAAASRVVGATTLPVAALMLSALPRLFSHHETRDRLLTPLIFLTSCGYGLLAGLAIFIFADLIAGLLGTRFEGVTVIVTTLAFAVPGMSLRLAGTTALMTSGRPWTRVVVEAMGLLLLGAGALSLRNMLHDQALPIAFAVSEWSMAILAWAILWRRRCMTARCE